MQDLSAPPARYFPVSPEPLRMQAGLRRFGVDFGNGDADGRFFQVDAQHSRYLDNKARLWALGAAAGRRHAVVDTDPAHARAHQAVRAWIEQRLSDEGVPPATTVRGPTSPAAARDPYAMFLRRVQEDAAVVHRDPDGIDRTIMVSVFSPSGWRPERIVGASFGQIHAPIPGFADEPRAAASMVAAMVERGPYVRFVWTVSADPHLDHHPDHGRREPFGPDGDGYLRVERQVTVPFPAHETSLFLIRTYVYGFGELSESQRLDLALALERMPAPIRAYKGLEGARDRVVARLRAAESSSGDLLEG